MKLEREMHVALGRYRVPYLALARRRRLRSLLVNSRTDLVIEGFPRSGNTFAVVAFELAQKTTFRIAHHHHAAAQVLEGVRLGIPVLVLVREPARAVGSLLVRHSDLRPGLALRWYRAFHEPLLVHRQQIVVASFDLVVTDFGRAIDALNSRFGTSFRRFEHTPANLDEVVSRARSVEATATDSGVSFENRVAVPSAKRSAVLAGKHDSLLQNETYQLSRCERLYRGLLAGPDVVD